MGFPARRSFLILAAVSFAAMVTGLSLQLHLLSQNHPQGHDSDHCPVCELLLAAPGKFTHGPQLELPDVNHLEGDAVHPLAARVAVFGRNPFTPRAPPLA